MTTTQPAPGHSATTQPDHPTPPEARCGSCSQHEEIARLVEELRVIHRVHIADIKALASAEEATRQALVRQLEQARGNECGMLCRDIEQDRIAQSKEIERLQKEGTPGVLHEVDRALHRSTRADRDRFSDLYRTQVERSRRLMAELRSRQYAVRLAESVERQLGETLGRAGSVNRDNLPAALTELVQERDRYREQLVMWTAPTSNVNVNEQIVATLQQRIGEAVGQDVARGDLVEMFELVLQYRGLGAEVPHDGDSISDPAEPTPVDRAMDQALQLVGEAALKDAALDKMGRDLLDSRVTIATQTETLQEYEVRHASLEKIAQAVGRQLTQALGWCDRARAWRAVDTGLLRTAQELIANAGLHDERGEHGRQHLEAVGRWVETCRSREATAHRASGPNADPLAGYSLRVVNNGNREMIRMHHARECDASWTWWTGVDGLSLLQVLDTAHRHIVEAHPLDPATAPLAEANGPDEASPDDETLPCEDICHPSHGACCGGKRNTPTEVNE